jgi:hypothetical protein
VACPANVTVITPPQAQLHMHVSLTAGTPLMVTLVEPGDHGPLITGMQGCGVRTPSAADVAAATWGFDGVMHIPNGGMFAMGAMSVILAAGRPPAVTVGEGTTSELGATPNEHIIAAPFTTSFGMPGVSHDVKFPIGQTLGSNGAGQRPLP